MSTRDTPVYIDGYYGDPVRISRTPREYPYGGRGNITAARYDAEYLVNQAQFVPTARGTVDPENAGCYLEAETKPEIYQGDIAKFRRTYASLPADVIDYGTRDITKPSPASSGAAVGFWADNAGNSSGLLAYLINLHYFLNGEIFGPRQACTSVTSGANTRITCPTVHGLAGTETIVAGKNDNSLALTPYRFTTGQYTVVDANTIDLLAINLTTSIVYLAEYLRAYTPGTAKVRQRKTQKFYLPGVTSGITTPVDIPVPATLLSDAALLAAVLANLTGFLAYDASELTRVNDGAIYTQTLHEIDMATL